MNSFTFDDALRIARGCLDYGGGYRRDKDLFQAYQDGILTVIKVLEDAKTDGLADSQIRALHAMGPDFCENDTAYMPVARVKLQDRGGNVGIKWYAAPINDYDSLPLLREGETLYVVTKGEQS